MAVIGIDLGGTKITGAVQFIFVLTNPKIIKNIN